MSTPLETFTPAGSSASFASPPLMIKKAEDFIDELARAALWIEPVSILLIELRTSNASAVNWFVAISPVLGSICEEFEVFVAKWRIEDSGSIGMASHLTANAGCFRDGCFRQTRRTAYYRCLEGSE
ncbi:hypothetical protein [Bradyrhizobium sp. S3.2.12]|uniref:hypothetical protein n=1 Tax=Bradyrhizobium sp. S3.2.12 TaxID=3156387 RepID=UPI003396FC78